ncbi:4a-hydroxytetrahydrobiopterin dehydratase [Salinactinospora qingdaonensis]
MPELLSAQAIEQELSELPGWTREGDTLTRTWEVKGFNAAMQLANVVAYVANRANHHPDILVHDYKWVTVTTTTHDSGGITGNDTALARTIEATL